MSSALPEWIASDTRLGFVATKPLQVITSLVIAQQLSHLPASLVVVPNFADAETIIRRLAHRNHSFERVDAVRTRFLAILALGARGASRIFVDSDVGLKTPIAMRVLRAVRPHVRFSLYEEGVSLIIPEPNDRPGPLLERLGATMDMGEDAYVDEVWSYTPDALRARLPTKTLYRIDEGVSDFVMAKWSLLTDLFWPTHDDDTRSWGGQRCTIYLSSWEIDPRATSFLTAVPGYSICKLHPHIRRNAFLPPGISQVLAASIPGELVILELAKVFDTVEVLHHGTSVARYVRAPNVRYTHVHPQLMAASSEYPVG